MKPVRKTYMKEYWACSIDTHHHTTKRAAQNCLDRVAGKAQYEKIWTRGRMRQQEMRAYASAGCPIHTIAKHYGVSENRVRVLIKRELQEEKKRSEQQAMA